YLGDVAGSTWGWLTFTGTQTLGGSGTVGFGSFDYRDNGLAIVGAAGSTLTIGPGVTVRGKNGTVTGSALVNQGTISADTAGGLISINASTWSSPGTLRAVGGGSLSLAGAFTVGTPLAISGGGSLSLTGTWSNTSAITANG